MYQYTVKMEICHLPNFCLFGGMHTVEKKVGDMTSAKINSEMCNSPVTNSTRPQHTLVLAVQDFLVLVSLRGWRLKIQDCYKTPIFLETTDRKLTY